MINSPKITLKYPISAYDVSLTVEGDPIKIPAAPNIATIGTGEDAELILYEDKTGDVLSVITRGFGNTTAKAWGAGEIIARNFTKYDFDSLVDNISGGTGDVFGPSTSADNTIARFNGTDNKTIQASPVSVDDNGTMNIPTGQKFKINNVDVFNIPKRSIFLSLAGGWTGTTLPDGGFVTLETATNKLNFKGTKFTASANNMNHEFGTVLPDNFASATATITARPVFITASTDASNHTIIFGLQAIAFASGDTMDTAYGSAQESTYVCAASIAGNVMIGAATAAITIARAPDGGQWCQFRCYRKGDDTMTGDVTLLGWLISYTTNNFSDE
jgi:hypothetical protein